MQFVVFRTFFSFLSILSFLAVPIQEAHAASGNSCKQAAPYDSNSGVSVNGDPKEDEGFFEGLISALFAATTSTTAEATSDASTELTSGKKQTPAVCAIAPEVYLAQNKKFLLRDLAQGEGEYLDSLLNLLGAQPEKMPRLRLSLRNDFPRLLRLSDTSNQAFLGALQSSVQANLT